MNRTSASVRVGLVGFGAIGRHHARNLRTMAGVELVGVAERKALMRAEARAAGYRTFPSVHALLAEGLDAAVVSVPTDAHEEVARALIDRSCALLVEKPLAQSLAIAKRILSLAERRGVPLMVGYVERYNPAVEAMRDFVGAGNLGRLINISARRVGVLPPRVKDANVLIDIGVHDIDLIAFITGARLNLITAQGGMALLEDRLDYATLMLEAEGCIVALEANWVTPVKLREMSLTGTGGFCKVDYMTQEVWFAPGRSFAPTATYEDLVAQYKEGTLVRLPVQQREPLARELEVFIDGVRGGALPDPRLALASLRIAEEATIAIERLHMHRSAAVQPA